jgi:hypothetical protein
MARMQELEIAVDASVGVVRPGDKLVVVVPPPASDQEVARARDMLQDLLPGVSVIVIPASGLVVYRR